jgi:regulatory protein YycI of two-component signal transduction system YycFG
MKRLLTFDEFVNEHYNVAEATDADGFNPTATTDKDEVIDTIKTVSELIPGKEYEFSDSEGAKKSMIFQGVTNGVYIFNSEDQKDAVRYTEEEISKVLSSGGAKKVAL